MPAAVPSITIPERVSNPCMDISGDTIKVPPPRRIMVVCKDVRFSKKDWETVVRVLYPGAIVSIAFAQT